MSVTNTLTPFLGDLLVEVQSALTAPVGRVFIAPGNSSAWDDCCSGQLWVRVSSIQSVQSSTSWNDCGVLYDILNLEMGIVRCAATVDNQGRAPATDQITADAGLEHQDALDIYAALKCDEAKFRNFVWTPSGPEGGCVGGSWSFQTTMRNCGC